jgi:hypothetical protein
MQGVKLVRTPAPNKVASANIGLADRASERPPEGSSWMSAKSIRNVRRGELLAPISTPGPDPRFPDSRTRGGE